MPQPLVSIIVPVYQAEKTLARCVESILAQSEKRLELILVDDGSTDGSAALCDQFGQEPRCTVLHQSNRGASAARNAGLALATGQYIQFVDSDDYLAPDFTENLVYAAEQDRADLVISGYQTVSNGVSKVTTPKGLPQITTAQGLAEHFDAYYFAVLLGSPCNKLYRRALCGAFPVEIKMGEDFMFNMAYLMGVEKIALSHASGYHYTQDNARSAHRTYRENTPQGMLSYCEATLPFLEKWLTEEQTMKPYRKIVFHSLCNNFNQLVRAGQDTEKAINAYLQDETIRDSIANAKLTEFPLSKRVVRQLLQWHMNTLALVGIRYAAGCAKRSEKDAAVNQRNCSNL